MILRRAAALFLVVSGMGSVSALLQSDETAPPKQIAFSILEDYDKGDDLREVAKDFALFRELGVTTWRGSFGWDDYEPSRGAYDFAWLHRFADLAASQGITLRPYIGYTPEWAAAGGTDRDAWNDPPKDVEQWYRFVKALSAAMRRHRNVVSFEIYNEENVRMWWDGSAAAYKQVLRRGIEAVKAGNPDAEVLLGGMVYPDAEWLESVCDPPGSVRRLAIIPFHAYPETWTSAGVTVENYLGDSFDSGFVHAADTACGQKPIWINETGFATVPGRTELDQARWWARAVPTFAAAPRIEHIGIYEIKDLRPDRPAIGDAPNYHLGITTVDRRKKAAFGTLQRLVSLLDGQRITVSDAGVTESPLVSGLYKHLFTRGDGRQLLFLWTTSADATIAVTLPTTATTATEYNVDGTPAGQLTLIGGALNGITLRPGEVRMFELGS